MVGTKSTPISMQNGVSVMPAGATNLGTNLSQDHPVSFTYNSALAAANGELSDPATLTNQVRLDSNSQMQCTACHDPHNNQFGNFLVMDNTGSALCATCHNDSLWTSSAHSISAAPLTRVASAILAQRAASPGSMQRAGATALAQRSAKTVGANGCYNCHAPHAAAGRQQLLLTARQEQTCFTCHNGTVVRLNIEAEFNKLSVHPVLQSSQLHDSSQTVLNASGQVTCSDCHNSHAAKSSTAPAPRASGAILGVKGVARSGAVVNPVTNEYELCFRCHGDTQGHVKASVDRLLPQMNLRLAFDPSSNSYHPVVATGKNFHVPSLLPPYTAGSMIKCTDCHNNDQGPPAGGSGPRGPHGSAFSPLLERQLITADFLGESVANDALCYKCHNRDSILSDQSFRAVNSLGQDCGHRFHVVDQKAACTTCHDSHGAANNKHLINFNPDYVTAASKGGIQYSSTGVLRGNCTLTCHGADHVRTAYPALMTAAPANLLRKR